VFEQQRTFMPVPQQLGRGDRMGRGPYEKSGLLEDSSLPPLRTLKYDYEIFFPVKEEETDEDVVRTFPSETLDILVQLWYLPYGTMDDDAFLWREEKRTVRISTEGN
jgi:hypothetical protein